MTLVEVVNISVCLGSLIFGGVAIADKNYRWAAILITSAAVNGLCVALNQI